MLWRVVCVVRRMEWFVCESSRRLCRARRIPRRAVWRVLGVVAGFGGDLDVLLLPFWGFGARPRRSPAD